MKRFFEHSRWLWAVAFGVWGVLLACNLPQSASAPPAPSQNQETRAAPAATATEIVLATHEGAEPQPQSTETPAPPTPSPTPSLTPTITLTPTPSTPMVSVSVNTNCRTGPGDAYDRVGALLVGETAEVLARDPYGLFWYIPNPDKPGGKCWVWGQYATVTGDTSSLPVFTPPPTPTPTADFAIVGITKIVCTATTIYEVKVRNTGGVAWRSFRQSALNVTTGTGYSQTGTLFFGSPVCFAVIPPNSEMLSSGEEGYLAPGFEGSPGQRMRFTITLYTGESQSGDAITHSAEYTLP